MIDASIIIVSYNTRGLLQDCLVSVPSGCTGLSTETFVVDNASSDGSAEMVGTEFPSVRLLCNVGNRGFAFANNLALRQASGRYVVLLNPDTTLQTNALTELVRFMDDTPAAGYCGPRLLNDNGSHQPSARRFPTVLSAAFSLLGLAHRYPGSRHALNLHALHGHRARFRADWMTGACLMVRSELLRRVGLLDEGYFLYFEETDWCRRMSSAGWEGWYVPSAEVIHLGGQSVVHASEVRPFSGDHPLYWVNSSSRYMRRHHGMAGMTLSRTMQIALYSLIWLRHCWRHSVESRGKARCAAAAVRHLGACRWWRHDSKIEAPS